MHLKRLGPYEIGEPLGKGGMGSVYAATDTTTGQRVAVKALTPLLASADGFRERFEAEIESLRTLRHEGIVRLYGYGEQDGVLYYSMELVEGTSLEDELKAGRRFNWREVTSVGIQLCLALKHAHDHGVVHRDIKPANVLLAGEEHVKLADFGIARLFGSSQLTTAGGVLGTADYMSPEQADGRPVTPRCDQYSLGGVMYALLAGRPPFRAKNLPQMLQLQRFAEPEPVRRYAPETPEQLERVILQLLAKDPADRFPNTQVLARHLQAMFKALSRPTAEEVILHDEGATKESGEADLGKSISTSQTHDDPGDWPSGPRDPTVSGGVRADVELVQGSLDNESDGAASHDAATLAADDPGKVIVPRVQLSPATKNTRLSTELRTKSDNPVALTTPARPAHFTTIEEAEAQRQAERRRTWQLIVVQLAAMAAMVAMVGVVIGLIYHMVRPATADELYDEVSKKAADSSDLMTPVERPLKEFFTRFPEDPRVEELRRIERQVALDQAHRRIQLAARRGGVGDSSLLPVEQLYLQALNASQRSPDEGIGMLNSLITLYSAPPLENGDTKASAKERERQSLCVDLARRQLVTLHREIAEETKRHLAGLRERLDAAGRLAESDRAQAIAMYRAIIGLHGDHGWASEIVAEAKRRLEDLEK